MTTYSGSISYSADNKAFGDGDENDFNVIVSGSISLSLTASSSGSVTGTGEITGTVSGSTNDDTDGDTDAFADDLSGDSTGVTGALVGGVNASFPNANGSVTFQGTFNSAENEITGTVTIGDSNLGSSPQISVTLFGPGGPGVTETVVPSISAPAQFQNSIDSAGDWTSQSDPVTYNNATGSWSLNSFKGVFDGVNYVVSEAKYYLGNGMSSLQNSESDEVAEAEENQIKTLSPQVSSFLSNANEALSLYQTLKTFQDDQWALIERGINSIFGTDDITIEEYDEQEKQIVKTLQTNLVSQLTGIPSSVLNIIESYAEKTVTLFGDSSPVFQVSAGSQAIGGTIPSDTYGIIGGSGSNTLIGGAGNSVLLAGTGNDKLVPGTGNEWLIGGPGFDQVVYSGNSSKYTITNNADGTVTIKGPNGTDTLFQIQQVVFADKTVSIGAPTPIDNLVFSTASGSVPVWGANGLQITSAAYTTLNGTIAGVPVPGWKVADATGDFSGNGNNDILWQTTAGQVAIWEMNGNQIQTAAFTTFNGSVAGVPAPGWQILGVADFFGTGDNDILWQTNTGSPAIWEMNGTQVTAAGYTTLNGVTVGAPGADWHIIGAGDFTGTGEDGILWRTNSGALAIWEMNGFQVTSAAFITQGAQQVGAPGPDWHLITTGDFDGDGRSDLLWETNAGQVAIWQMNGAQIVSAGYVSSGSTIDSAPTGWRLAGAADVNGDGKADLLWQTPGGQVAVWEMNGTQVIGSGYLTTNGAIASTPSDWTIAQHNYNFI